MGFRDRLERYEYLQEIDICQFDGNASQIVKYINDTYNKYKNAYSHIVIANTDFSKEVYNMMEEDGEIEVYYSESIYLHGKLKGTIESEVEAIFNYIKEDVEDISDIDEDEILEILKILAKDIGYSVRKNSTRKR